MTPRDRSPDRLFMRDEQLELIDRSAEQQALETAGAGSAEDDARRATYLERLRDMLPELREMEGFPIGTDEDILALSDPPYYNACPNPFLGEFIAEHGTPYDEATDDYHREPFAADVSEGKNDPIYNAHSYHTKVPHKAIMRYILHYTKPGDIVFDGFCGTGMTGVAAQLCGSPDPAFKAQVEAEWKAAGHELPQWGTRYAVLGDLSPAATFIAYTYNTPVDVRAFEREAKRILDEVEAELGWMYEAIHTDGSKGRINYTVWADVFLCPSCGAEVNFWDGAVDEASGVVREEIRCDSCDSASRKATLDRKFETTSDLLGDVHRRAVQVPVLIDYSVRGKRIRRRATPGDVERSARVGVPSGWVPFDRLPPGEETSRNAGAGLVTAGDFYHPRGRQVLARYWDLAGQSSFSMSMVLRFVMTSAHQYANRLCRLHIGNYFNGGGGVVDKPLEGTLYLPSLSVETNAIDRLRLRSRLSRALLATARNATLTTGSNAVSLVPDGSVDYLFTDPPFGANLQYSELSYLWESWLKVRTRQDAEAVVNRVRGIKLQDYQARMEDCFRENYRILKPGRWMTVEFHNSRNSVWNAIQEAIQRAGFVVADVRTLDKGKGSFKQTTSAGAVKQDLVISAYRPRAGFEQRFELEAGTEQGAWDFVRQHLEQLPVFVERGGLVEVIAERQDYLLFDRMVAFHIQRGVTIPLSAAAFYAGLRQRFPERDGMFFTELQAAEYDQRRLEARDVEQLSVFVVDEKSAIAWLRVELGRESQTFQDLQPKFLRELQQNRFEALPELRDILDQNFLEDEGTHRWRVPDPGKQADLEALRGRALLAEFATYRASTGKLKRFRIEAVRAGFADLWAQRDYRGIIALAERLPDEVVQEDPALLMYYDNAVTRESVG